MMSNNFAYLAEEPLEQDEQDGQHVKEVEENIAASSPTYPSSPSIIVSSSPNNSETRDSSEFELVKRKERGGKPKEFKFLITSWNPDKHVCEAASVLLFTKRNDQIYFLLGMDRSERCWTCFGGKKKKQESPIDNALRELGEETYGLLAGKSIVLNHKDAFFIEAAKQTVFLCYLKDFSQNDLEQWNLTAQNKCKDITLGYGEREIEQFGLINMESGLATIPFRVHFGFFNKHQPSLNLLKDLVTVMVSRNRDSPQEDIATI